MSTVRTLLLYSAGFLLNSPLLLPVRAQPARQPLAEHVVMISIDGLRPEFYLDSRWPAPWLQQMVQEGVHAQAVRGVFPTVTYPSHTTLITGALPIRHGIYYNSPFEEGGQTGRWYWEWEKIRVKTLWQAVEETGRKSASVYWPVTAGAPVTYNVPEVWSLDPKEDRFSPVRAQATPKGLVEEIEREATGRLSEERSLNGDYLTREDRFGAMAAYLLETYKPAFLTVHLASADHFQHEQGREGVRVRQAVAAADRAVGQIVEAAYRAGIAEQTAFVIVGDHGFVDIHSQLCPNVWLAQAGLMEDKKDRGNWQAAFHTSGAAAFLQLKNPADKKAVAHVRRLLESRPDPEKKLFRIVERAELDRIGADPGVPLALTPVRGVSFSASPTGPAIKPAKGGTHGYFPDFQDIHTGFIGWGKGFNPGATLPMMGLEDVAPLVAELLGLSFKAPDGVLYPGLLMLPPPKETVRTK